MMRRDQLCWLAGLLEGEGCFSLDPDGRPRIQLCMTDEDVVALVAGLIGCSYSQSKSPYIVQSGRKPLYRLAVSGTRAAVVMEGIYPMLGARRRAKIDEILAKRRPLRRASTLDLSVPVLDLFVPA